MNLLGASLTAVCSCRREQVNLDEGKFMRWYYAEKRREKYEEENPPGMQSEAEPAWYSLLLVETVMWFVARRPPGESQGSFDLVRFHLHWL